MDKQLHFTIKDYFSCLIFISLLFFVSIYINSILYDGTDKINFMYVVSPPQEGLPFLNEENGWFVYMMHFTFTAFTAITLCYIKPIINAIKEKCKSK